MNLRYLYLIKQTIAHNQQGFNSLLAKRELQVIYSNTQEKCYLLWNTFCLCPNLSSNNMLNQYILSYQIILFWMFYVFIWIVFVVCFVIFTTFLFVFSPPNYVYIIFYVFVILVIQL